MKSRGQAEGAQAEFVHTLNGYAALLWGVALSGCGEWTEGDGSVYVARGATPVIWAPSTRVTLRVCWPELRSPP